MTLLLEFRDDGMFCRQPAGEPVDDSPMPLHVILGLWTIGSVLGLAAIAALAMAALQVFPWPLLGLRAGSPAPGRSPPAGDREGG